VTFISPIPFNGELANLLITAILVIKDIE